MVAPGCRGVILALGLSAALGPAPEARAAEKPAPAPRIGLWYTVWWTQDDQFHHWNNFEEETAIEDSYGWEDGRGFAVPDLCTRITRAYSRLRSGALVKGEYSARSRTRKCTGSTAPGWFTRVRCRAGRRSFWCPTRSSKRWGGSTFLTDRE